MAPRLTDERPGNAYFLLRVFQHLSRFLDRFFCFAIDGEAVGILIQDNVQDSRNPARREYVGSVRADREADEVNVDGKVFRARARSLLCDLCDVTIRSSLRLSTG